MFLLIMIASGIIVIPVTEDLSKRLELLAGFWKFAPELPNADEGRR